MMVAMVLVAHNPGQEATDRRDALQENTRACVPLQWATSIGR
jgi:hypothetical protein